MLATIVCLLFILPAVALGADTDQLGLYVKENGPNNIPSNDPMFEDSAIGVGITYFNVLEGTVSMPELAPLRERYVEIFIDKSDPEQLREIAKNNDMEPELFNDPTIVEAYLIGLITPNMFPDSTIYKNAADTHDYERRLQEMLTEEFGMEQSSDIPLFPQVNFSIWKTVGGFFLFIILLLILFYVLRKRSKNKALKRLEENHRPTHDTNPINAFLNYQDNAIDDIVVLIEELEKEKKDNEDKNTGLYVFLDKTINDINTIKTEVKDTTQQPFLILDYFGNGKTTIYTTGGRPVELTLDHHELKTKLNKKISRIHELDDVLAKIKKDIENNDALSLKSENQIVTPEQTKQLYEFLKQLSNLIINLQNTWNKTLPKLKDIAKTLDKLHDKHTERRENREQAIEDVQRLVSEYNLLIKELTEWNAGD
jgi:hypothetical protein